MNKEILPIFKSHYSLNSILTLEKVGDSEPEEPNSIFDIAKEHKLDKVVLIEDNPSGFLEAINNSKESKIQLIFGLRLTVTQDINQKDEESLSKNHKVIILMKSSAAWKRLIKIWSKAATDGFYYFPRTDFKSILEQWDDNDLMMCIPFFDGFIHRNLMSFSSCIPDFSKIKPTFFIEEHDLPFNNLIKEKITNYIQTYNYSIIQTHSCYYYLKNHFPAFMTYKCIQNRSCWDKPELNGFSTDDFCFESYLKRINE